MRHTPQTRPESIEKYSIFSAPLLNSINESVIIRSVVHHESENLHDGIHMRTKFVSVQVNICGSQKQLTRSWMPYIVSVSHTASAIFSPVCSPISSRKLIKSSSEDILCKCLSRNILILMKFKRTELARVVCIVCNNCQKSIHVT